MNIKNASLLYDRLLVDSYTNNLFARANARYVLFGVNERRENFPNTLEFNLDAGSDSLSFTYLSIGCTLAESEVFDERAKNSLERGAEIIEYNHLHLTNRNKNSQYYLLIGALAYYASFQYSKAFIMMQEASNYETDISILVSAFLKKDFIIVTQKLNEILLEQSDYLLISGDNYLEKVNHPHIVIFAKALSNLMDYLYTGFENSLNNANNILNDLLNLLILDMEPSLWWVTRMFKIVTNGFNKSSLWSTIPPIMPDSQRDIVDKYISNLIFSKKKIVELFTAQRSALPLIKANKGGVVSLPTSSGKTQIAIIAILKALTENDGIKVLYIAPYRSLAYEVENSLKEAFEILNFEVSQLYGSAQFGKLDKILIEDTDILIATPEKAKVILRGNAELANLIKLVIIDEGHLIDASRRNVKNELFIEELKVSIKSNNGNIILLSAVLPNTEDIAKWIANDSSLSVIETERLARQRLGLLNFSSDKNSVSLEWVGDERVFNNNFIHSIPPKGRRKLPQPIDKSTSVAMTALRLSENNKSVLIFTAIARSVNTYANNVITSMKLLYGKIIPHIWDDRETWHELKLLCSEYDSKENKKLIQFAEYGILCHYGSLSKDIKNVLERLMRNSNPRIIVATMTLGQGVNLGVSTVIIADTEFNDIEKRSWIKLTQNEVWNIVGRAGRAFQDIEGKILFAAKNEKERQAALTYIQNPPKNITSGLLLQIKRIKALAKECNINFVQLLEMIAENNFDHFKDFELKSNRNILDDEFHEVFDWMDDVILSLDTISKNSERSIDDIFRDSLAYIQAEDLNGITQLEVLSFLNARNKAIDRMIPASSSRKHLSTSSLPLASAIALDEVFDNIINYGNEFLGSNQEISDKLKLLKKIEMIVENFPSLIFQPKKNHKGEIEPSPLLVNEVRKLWISGKSLSNASHVEKAIKLSNQYYSFTLSWVLGAIGNKCRALELEELAKVFENLALSCEVGLPNAFCSKIYLSGVKSRSATMEIYHSDVFNFYKNEELSIKEIRKVISDNFDELIEDVEDTITVEWLKIFKANHKMQIRKIERKFEPFILPKPDFPDLNTTRLYVKSLDNENFYLASPDYSESFTVETSKQFPFHLYANRMDRFFKYLDGKWIIK